jgi:RimJ/RimL family protein N-acetyltransferase
LPLGSPGLSTTRIIGVVDHENAASLRVPERIGMTRMHTIEAHGRPHVLFAASEALREDS